MHIIITFSEVESTLAEVAESPPNLGDLCCTHRAQRSLYGLSTRYVTHVTLDTRPSHFSACNIENAGVAWGRGYSKGVYHSRLYK